MKGEIDMKLKTIIIFAWTVLLTIALSLAFNIESVKSDYTWTQTIYIRANGSIESLGAPISTEDNVTYTLTDNIVGVVPADTSAIAVERDNIVIDGAGYIIQDTGVGIGTAGFSTTSSNITIRNITIKGFYYGIILGYSSNNTVSGNNITANHFGVIVEFSADNTLFRNDMTNNEYGVYLGYALWNIVSGNDITNNTRGICLNNSLNNTVFHNNFVGNSKQVDPDVPSFYNNFWDNGYASGGNYWDTYLGVDLYNGPFQNETGGDGIGDTPYTIDLDNVDHYPLMFPWRLGDINHDGAVNVLDLILVSNQLGWTGPPGSIPEDVNEDGAVNVLDLIVIATNLGATWF